MAQRAVVIGAGITGVLVARALRADGWAVTLLDTHHPGAGSSSRTAAGCRQQFSTPSTVRGMRHAMAAYDALGEEIGTPVLKRHGYLFLVGPGGRAAAEARVAVQREAGLADVRWVDVDAIAEIGPAVDPARVEGGTWCPSDGFLLPQLVYQEGTRLLRQAGGEVRARAEVVSGTTVGGRLTAVHTVHGPVEGDLFVDATNAWTGRLTQRLQATPLPVQATTRYLWFLARGEAASADDLVRWPMVISPSGTYVRPENRDTLLMGRAVGDAVEDGDLERAQDAVPTQYAHDGGLETAPVSAWMDLAEAMPDLGALGGLTATAGGLYAITPDHNPFLGFDPAIGNLIRLVGFSGHGAMFGPFTAVVGAALAAAGKDLPGITLPEGYVDLQAFHLGRDAAAAESMVI